MIRGGDGGLEIVDVAQVDDGALLIHDPRLADPGLAFSLARLAQTPAGPTPIGIFRDVERPVYRQRAGTETASDEQLADLLAGGDTWTVSA